MIVLAHLSDTHFDGGERSEARARLVMDYVHGLPGTITAVVVTGDITDNGRPEEHHQAERVLTSELPVFTCPGNHDGYTPYGAPRNGRYDLGEATLILLDSVVQGRDEGHLADETIDWLTLSLGSLDDQKPILIGLHHPPVRLHHPLIDGITLSSSSQRHLARLIVDNPAVVAILCGHAHTPAAATFAGRPVLVAPGVASTLSLPWEIGTDITWQGSLDRNRPPGLAFHVISDDGTCTTHFRLLTD